MRHTDTRCIEPLRLGPIECCVVGWVCYVSDTEDYVSDDDDHDYDGDANGYEYDGHVVQHDYGNDEDGYDEEVCEW